jgi:hypothetical protein
MYIQAFVNKFLETPSPLKITLFQDIPILKAVIFIVTAMRTATFATLAVVQTYTDRGKRFTSSPKCPDWLWGPPSLPFNGYWGRFPLGKSGQGMRLTTCPHVVSSLKMNGAILLLRVYVFMLCIETTLPVYHFTEYMC